MKTVALLSLLHSLVVWTAGAQQTSQPRIDVNGEAVVNVKPDKIVMTVGIETRDTNIMSAKQKNSDVLEKALTSFKTCGVADNDIQTDQLSIQPRWEDEYRVAGFIGYFVRSTIVISLVDVARVEELVTGMLQAGVNHMHGIDFQTTEFKKYRDQARELALKAAQEKAGKMALFLGQTLGDPIHIEESYTGSPWRCYSSWWGFGSGQAMSQNVAQNVQAEGGELSETIPLGKISIRANVHVTFALKK